MKRPPAMSRPRPRRDGSLTMAHGWLILADDLTGAADCAIAFGRRGHAAAVTWGDDRRCQGSPACRFWRTTPTAGPRRPRRLRAATPMYWTRLSEPGRHPVQEDRFDAARTARRRDGRGDRASEVTVGFGVRGFRAGLSGHRPHDRRGPRPRQRPPARGSGGLAARPQLSERRSRRRPRHRRHSRREGPALATVRGGGSRARLRATGRARATSSRSAMPRPRTTCTASRRRACRRRQRPFFIGSAGLAHALAAVDAGACHRAARGFAAQRRPAR